jgi:hypothetical protein
MGLAHLRYVSFSYGAHLTHRDNSKMMRLVTSPRYRDLRGDRFAMLKFGEQKIENDQTGWKFEKEENDPNGCTVWGIYIRARTRSPAFLPRSGARRRVRQ